MKSPSGKFVLRIPPPLHQSLNVESKKKGLSLNQYCFEILESRFKGKQNDLSLLLPHAKKIISKLKQKFQDSFLGMIVFGSRALGENTESSDLDLLIILDKSTLLNRGIYRWWDEQNFDLTYPVNPHFVLLPAQPEGVGSLWLEAATTGKLLLDTNNKISLFIQKIRDVIDQGFAQRAWSHGHPYWTWNNHEK